MQVVSYNRISRSENPLSGFERDSAIKPPKLYVPSTTLFSLRSFSVAPPSLEHYLVTVDVCRGEETGPDSSLKVSTKQFLLSSSLSPCLFLTLLSADLEIRPDFTSIPSQVQNSGTGIY
jgi:hypothetical protein